MYATTVTKNRFSHIPPINLQNKEVWRKRRKEPCLYHKPTINIGVPPTSTCIANQQTAKQERTHQPAFLQRHSCCVACFKSTPCFSVFHFFIVTLHIIY